MVVSEKSAQERFGATGRPAERIERAAAVEERCDIQGSECWGAGLLVRGSRWAFAQTLILTFQRQSELAIKLNLRGLV